MGRNGSTPGKPSDTPASRTWLVSHVASAGLVACKRKLFLTQLFVAKSAWTFLQNYVISSVETVGSKIKDNKPVKTDISIFLFTPIVSAFIPQIMLFKGHNQAPQNTRNQDFSLQLPVLQKTRQIIILSTNRVSK